MIGDVLRGDRERTRTARRLRSLPISITTSERVTYLPKLSKKTEPWHLGAVRYRPILGGRLLIDVVFLAFSAAAVLLVATTLAGSDNAPPALFTALWLAALAWNAYWWLFRIAAELVLDPDVLTALSPLRVRKVWCDEL